MGYELHIVATADWSQPSAPSIEESAWRAVIAADPTLDPIEEQRAENPATGETIVVSCPGSAAWSGHPEHASVVFGWRRGRISMKYFDELTQAKMIEVAARLGGVVVGDEGETYS